MAAGAGAGTALERPLDRSGRLEAVVAAPKDPAVATPEAVAAPAGPAGIDADVLDRTSDKQQLPSDPDIAVPSATLPADPLLIDQLTTDEAGLTAADRRAGLLSLAVPTSASGRLVVVPGTSPAPFVDRPVRTVRVEVESGLEVDGVLFAEMVMATLNDQRGWGADGSLTFARTDGEAEIRVVLASPELVDDLCAPLETVGQFSCGRNGHAALNHTRWVQATAEFTDRALYRGYLVNHEVGHLLGHGHEECPGAGVLAPLMQQQSASVGPCLPNAWPFPDAGA